MNRHRPRVLLFLLILPGLATAQEPVDLNIVHRIKQEAFDHSRVMDYLNDIADENGPRITGSPGHHRAAQEAIADYKAAGIDKAGVEVWGTFGRGWQWSRIAVQMHKPQETTLTAYPGDWTAASDGPVGGEVVFVPLWGPDENARTRDLVKKAEQIEAWKARWHGKLAGKVVMMEQPELFKLPEQAPQYTYSAEDLAKEAESLPPGLKPELHWPLIDSPLDPEERSRQWDSIPLEVAADYWLLDLELVNRIAAFLVEEKVSAVLTIGWSHVAAVIMKSDVGSFRDGDPIPPPTAVLMPEQYNRIVRLIKRDIPVEVTVDVDDQFYPSAQGSNVIAEIPASGRSKEVVMLGAHLDSWHGATGATDNGAGSAVVMEVMRILKALNLPMKRTVRAALWDGEEEGLFGSRNYVKNHFGDPVTMQLKPEHKDLSVYFNLDNGGGKIRGVYLQGNDMARPIFAAWLAPFADLGVTTETINNTHGTDHLSFDQVGLPGFQFIQDPLDYEINTHHSNVDDVGHIIPGDLMQAAAVMAASVYFAATRDEMFPREPLPAPLPPRGPLPEILKHGYKPH